METQFELEDVEIVEVKCRAWLKFRDMKIPAEFTLKPEDFENSKEIRGFDLMFLSRGGILDPDFPKRWDETLKKINGLIPAHEK